MLWDNTGLAAYDWQSKISSLEEKTAMARKVAAYAKDGDVIGVGTGSSSYIGLCELSKRIKSDGIKITVVPAAREIQLACGALGIPYTGLICARPDWHFDGCDEIGENGDVIKGRGGGLYLEKLLICSSPKVYILAGKSKFVKKVGAKPVPIEVFPEAIQLVKERLLKLGAIQIKIRDATGKDGPAVTEHGNILVDCHFADVYPGLEKDIKSIPGVIESGLFQGYDFELIRADV